MYIVYLYLYCNNKLAVPRCPENELKANKGQHLLSCLQVFTKGRLEIYFSFALNSLQQFHSRLSHTAQSKAQGYQLK